MIAATQKRAIDAIVSVFETGKLPSPAAYSTVAILSDGAGISYGMHQTTAASSLPALLEEYIRRDGLYAARIRGLMYLLPSTRAMSSSSAVPEAVALLVDLLRAAGADPIMQEVQRDTFNRLYWEPATTYAGSLGLETALSHLAVYDTWVHSGGGRVANLRERFPATPPSRLGDERVWTAQFCRARRDWLAGFTSVDPKKQKLVRTTVYRVDALLDLIADDAWDLALPLVVRGVRIT